MKPITNRSFDIAISSLREHEDSNIDFPVLVGRLRGEEFSVYYGDDAELIIEDLGVFVNNDFITYSLTDQMKKRLQFKLKKHKKELEKDKAHEEYHNMFYDKDEYFMNGVSRYDF